MSCPLCQQNVQEIDFKNTQLLKKFLSPLGKIRPKKKTKLCAWHQRKIAKAIKRARYLGLLPYVTL